jgi:HD-GYP domain-containing protein (c-di-GMP phosphodiesterase class II)
MIDDKQIFDADLDINLGEFVQFYLKVVNRNLNHLGIHSENAAIVSVALAKQMNFKCPEVKLLKYGSLLHDIGKLFVPAEILNSSRPLTYTEFEIIKTHTVAGYEALDNFKTIPKEIKLLAMKHHYRYGFGYPKHLIYDNGIDQTLIDILTIADSFSAIMEPRIYKKGVTELEAYEIMTDETNEKNKGLNQEVMDNLKYLVDKQKITLKEFF